MKVTFLTLLLKHRSYCQNWSHKLWPGVLSLKQLKLVFSRAPQRYIVSSLNLSAPAFAVWEFCLLLSDLLSLGWRGSEASAEAHLLGSSKCTLRKCVWIDREMPRTWFSSLPTGATPPTYVVWVPDGGALFLCSRWAAFGMPCAWNGPAG